MPTDVRLDPTATIPRLAPTHLLEGAIAIGGIAWNLFGVVQFVGFLRNTPESLMKMGMTPEQAAIYSSYPAWMTIAFAVGVFGGLAGSLLLLAKRGLARHAFAGSLVGYIALYIGDITEGVFAALGASQVAILSTVVAIAIALLGWSIRFERARALL